jgi:hypothetical protein
MQIFKEGGKDWSIRDGDPSVAQTNQIISTRFHGGPEYINWGRDLYPFQRERRSR